MQALPEMPTLNVYHSSMLCYRPAQFRSEECVDFLACSRYINTPRTYHATADKKLGKILEKRLSQWATGSLSFKNNVIMK
eukprot:1140615-Pelagomonas_calceolata.AAC.2